MPKFVKKQAKSEEKPKTVTFDKESDYKFIRLVDREGNETSGDKIVHSILAEKLIKEKKAIAVKGSFEAKNDNMTVVKVKE